MPKRRRTNGTVIARRKTSPARRRAGAAATTKPAVEPGAAGKKEVPPERVVVELRINDDPKEGTVATVADTPLLGELAAKWMYILRNRSRWLADDELRLQINDTAKEDLARLGVSDAALLKICTSPFRHCEVAIHDSHETGRVSSAAQQAAMAFPWEFVISAATKQGRAETLVITRLLPRDRTLKISALQELLFVQSAPGRLDGFYSFESERTRLRAATGHRPWKVSDSDTLERLAARIETYKPDVLHVSGIDNHQAAQIIEGFYTDTPLRADLPHGPDDGMIVRRAVASANDPRSLPPEQPVPYDDLVKHLFPATLTRKPRLVTCNLYYSSACIAPECIRRGAQAAIGFQDEVDDELAELFFQEFYRALYKSPLEGLPRAFGHAWGALRTHREQLYGTGIVLWLAQSAFTTKRRPTLGVANGEESSVPQLLSAKERRATRALPITEVLQVELKVPKSVNYSLLHNARPFVEKFTLNKLVTHTLDEVAVTVDLNVGDGSLPFRYTERLLDSSQRDVSGLVTVPLTAPLLRSLRERVQTTLYAKVSWDQRVAHESTESVTLLPVDEWLDDTNQNPWLPSFILPRDPAVARIISAARQHLVTLLDDPAAGFDGYQSVTGKDDPPLENVDMQVRAIWAALVNEFKLLYINPPPAYSKQSQRLRTPSEILLSGSGTCIDLALLLAACLEYIDIYPVVVLLSGHAFVGYWRNCDDHDRFRGVGDPPPSLTIRIGDLSRASSLSLVDDYEWRLAGQQYAEIKQYLRKRQLRFLEATGLCFNYSFADALKEGAANMGAPDEFDSLLDVRLARMADPPVTPLPIIDTRNGNGDES